MALVALGIGACAIGSSASTLPRVATAKSTPLLAGWRVTATAFRGRIGTRHTYVCPSGGTRYVVWGSGPYTDDSSVCTAAVHAGRITLSGGGTVVIQMRAGQSSYRASTRNGVRTRSYRRWPGSFRIVSASRARFNIVTFVGGSGWSSTATAYRGLNHVRFTYTCPGNETARGIWGTDIYTDDSSVCTAAVHAGRISLLSGGTVMIAILPGRTSYTGTTRNGITSRSYGTWGGSYAFTS